LTACTTEQEKTVWMMKAWLAEDI